MDYSSHCHPHCHRHRHHHHCHHHHHHHHPLLPHCPIHCSQLSKLNPNIAHFLPFSPLNFCKDSNFKVSDGLQAANEDTQLILEGDGKGLEAEDEVEYAFVLTDEWKEFFAKSEAKRRLAKKQAKKKMGQ
ncbi:uncharacterized protein LOC108211781 [Daucus carota subsp. sativus]|uniref:uncharacterized protein LOC108211781 n=1 Tax=Daucus carota subsp. sativus TaxID=79200 RepID=UPI0007EFB624|nr:PREDICTED: forkhead box protein G1-like isoform X2 [Daucus carota subsp. sativus]